MCFGISDAVDLSRAGVGTGIDRNVSVRVATDQARAVYVDMGMDMNVELASFL